MAIAAEVLSKDTIVLHGTRYKRPTRPVVVVCVDGFDPTYLEQGIADVTLPTLASFVKNGFHKTAKVAMPSFTNPNNVSIITGVPTAIHGIAGNYFLDSVTGKEMMVLDDSLLRGSTILAEMAAQGVRVAAITAKDKLRRIIDHGLTENCICFSTEKATDAELKQWVGRSQRPDQYSGDLSLCVLDAGIKILEAGRADLFYLTLSDFVQHKHAPGTPEATEFMQGVDSRIGRLVELGAVVAVTGDHGMSDKSKTDGSPNALFVQDALEIQFNLAPGQIRVICPITDPFVKHHGALGGFVRVHVLDEAIRAQAPVMVDYLRELPAVEVALLKEDAAREFEMPLDREGDFVVVSKKNFVVGGCATEHDLSTLGDHRLRSHGGLSEQDVPLLMSMPITEDESTSSRQWRNFSIFDLILNHGQ
ncbi:hypothetical protein SEUCBS140593_004566 [Sporothrix eucalyptigena]|uniref:Phosphonoacetate hydrolase n=1 Tax=Sporothrix eucalyptigena TaxID=1812306 RepID=A0ABP0BPR2_9PEZI